MAATYTRILEKISRSQTDTILAQKIFRWVVCAKRPLQLAELSEAIAFDFNDTFYDFEKVPKTSRLIPACGNLILLDEIDDTVRFAHHTVQQFLFGEPIKSSLGDFHFLRNDAELYTGLICMTYLLFSDFESQVMLRKTPKMMLFDALPSPAMVLERTTHEIGLRNSILQRVFVLGKLHRTVAMGKRMTDFDIVKHTVIRLPAPSLREKYVLLDYGVEHWLEHARWSVSKSPKKRRKKSFTCLVANPVLRIC